MTTIHAEPLNFNTKITISNDGGQLSNDGGLVLVPELLNRIYFDDIVKEEFHFPEYRKYYWHSPEDLLKQAIFQLIAGYNTDSAADSLAKDPVMKLMLSKEDLAFQSSLSRFYEHLDTDNIEELQNIAITLGDLFLKQMNQHEMVLDIDSTHSDTYGDQEDSDYNAHYQKNGYHPLVCFDGLTGMFLGAKLRPGNEYTSKNAEDFLLPIIQHYRSFDCEMNLLVRGDSGFAKPEIYDLCDTEHIKFVIRLKSNVRLQDTAEHLVLYSDDTDFTKSEVQWHEIQYQAKSWKKSRRVIVKSTRDAGSYLFRHEFVVTNLEGLFADQIFRMYQNRGTMENFIKEIKSGFFFDKTDSHSFTENAARMMVSCVAYNILHLMKWLVFPKRERTTTIGTIRFKLFHIAAKVTKHMKQFQIHLSSSNVYDSLFWQVLQRIQQFQLV